MRLPKAPLVPVTVGCVGPLVSLVNAQRNAAGGFTAVEEVGEGRPRAVVVIEVSCTDRDGRGDGLPDLDAGGSGY